MADKRLLYFTAQRISIYAWKGSELALEQGFASGEEGVSAFGVYVSEHPDSLYYVLADLVEEDFTQESIPAVRGKDRTALVGRKIAQRYRDPSLALALSLGIAEVGGRREEKVLFTSFTNTQLLQAWLTVLRSREARLVGVYSMALITPVVGTRIRFKNLNYLMVSVAEGGLRQTYVENGQVRFSRLGRADRSDPRALAEICATESSRIQQYLVSLRLIQRNAGPLDVIMLAPSRDKAHYDAACRPTASLQFHVLDLDETARAAGLKKVPDGVAAEALFLHILAGAQPRQQFAGDEIRHYYHLWRARIATVVAGAAAFVFCVLLSLMKLVDIYHTTELARLDQQQEAVASQQYARMQLTFPKTPTDSDKLRTIVKNYQKLTEQASSPEPLFGQISNALASSPQIDLERIDWNASTNRPADGRPSGAAAGGLVQTAQIAGRINIAQTNDYRAITLIVDQFVESLRNQAGIAVVSRRLPFDITSEKSLSGDISEKQTAEVPRFTVVIVRKIGS